MAGLAGALLRAAPRVGLEPAAALAPAARRLGARPHAGVAHRRGARARLRLAHAGATKAAVNSWAMLTAARVVAWSLYVAQAQLLGLLWFDWLWGRFAGDEADGRRRGRVPRPLAGRHRGEPGGRLPGLGRPDVPQHAVLGQRAARRRHAARRQRLRHAGRARRASGGMWLPARGDLPLAAGRVRRERRRVVDVGLAHGARLRVAGYWAWPRGGAASRAIAGPRARRASRPSRWRRVADRGGRARLWRQAPSDRCAASPRCRSRAPASRTSGAAAATAPSPCRCFATRRGPASARACIT